MAMRFMLAVIFFGLSFVEANILIESRDEQFANSAQTLLRVRVFNDSKDTLQNVELRYFLSCKERPIILDKHHPQNLSAEIVTAGSECSVLKIAGEWPLFIREVRCLSPREKCLWEASCWNPVARCIL